MEPKKDERLTFLSLEDVCCYLKCCCIKGKDLKEEDLVEVYDVPFTASEFWGRESKVYGLTLSGLAFSVIRQARGGLRGPDAKNQS